MSSGDAARVLGVSARQVRRLAEAGALTAVERVGGTLLLDSNSVHRLAGLGSQRGRPWSFEAAVDPLPVTVEVARAWGRLAATVARRGGKPRRRRLDLAIAATAVTQECRC